MMPIACRSAVAQGRVEAVDLEEPGDHRRSSMVWRGLGRHLARWQLFWHGLDGRHEVLAKEARQRPKAPS